MSPRQSGGVEQLRGASRLVIDAVVGLAEVVEAMHANIARLPPTIRGSAQRRAGGISGLVYGSVRGIARGVGAGLDAALAQLLPKLVVQQGSEASPRRAAIVAALNGVFGDHLAETGNALAMPMQLCREGRALVPEREALATAIDQPRSRLLLLVHGLCMNDLQWRGASTDPAEDLARELGCTAIYLRYNTGRHVSVNGRELAALLERLLEQWPVPVEEVAIVAHSMGGLVARSACHYAALASMRWPARLRQLVMIATPHHGAPLEKGGHWIDLLLGATPYTAPLARLGRIRSAGITDLRHGNVVDEDWQGRDRFGGAADDRRGVPLPGATACYVMAGTRASALGSRWLGDGLVAVDSALGRDALASRDLGVPASRQWTGSGIAHIELMTRPEVWSQIRAWLGLVT